MLHYWERRRTTWWTRLLGRLGRRYWIARIDYVLSEAKQAGRLDNDLLHELDARLKYYPERRWGDAQRRTPARATDRHEEDESLG